MLVVSIFIIRGEPAVAGSGNFRKAVGVELMLGLDEHETGVLQTME